MDAPINMPMEAGKVYEVTASFVNGPHRPGFVVRLTDDNGSISVRNVRAKSLWRAARKVHRLTEPGGELAGWRITEVLDLRPIRFPDPWLPPAGHQPAPRRGVRKVRRSDG